MEVARIWDQGRKDRAQKKERPKFFRPKFFHGRPCGMSVPKCEFFQDLEGLTEVLARMFAGTSGRKLPLWANLWFLKKRVVATWGPFTARSSRSLNTRSFLEPTRISTLWELCRTSARKWTFLTSPLFPKSPFCRRRLESLLELS